MELRFDVIFAAVELRRLSFLEFPRRKMLQAVRPNRFSRPPAGIEPERILTLHILVPNMMENGG